MKSELKMYQEMVTQYKADIERINREMQNLKKMYYEQKKVNKNISKKKNNENLNEALDLALNI